MTDCIAGKFQVEHRKVSRNGAETAHVAFLPKIYDSAAEAIAEAERLRVEHYDVKMKNLTPEERDEYEHSDSWEPYWMPVTVTVPSDVWVIGRRTLIGGHYSDEAELVYGFLDTETEARELCAELDRVLTGKRQRTYDVQIRSGRKLPEFAEWVKLLPKTEYLPLRLPSTKKVRLDPDRDFLFEPRSEETTA